MPKVCGGDRIPVIDLFAGPGGLGEGFSAFRDPGGSHVFRIALSVEKDPIAHQTLQLRAFFRQFSEDRVPEEYYAYLRGDVTRDQLFKKHVDQADAASKEAQRLTLGEADPAELDRLIREAIGGPKAESWVLIGGPPCQAYSLAGRSRTGGIDRSDKRVHLYKEYLRILAVHKPPIFVMENVKGLLSSMLEEDSIFDLIQRDLQNPSAVFPDLGDVRYRLLSFVRKPRNLASDSGSPLHEPGDFVIRSENYGVPQARHRVIILGVRSDLPATDVTPLKAATVVPVRDVLQDLPQLRSGLSREEDSPEAWGERIREIIGSKAMKELRDRGKLKLAEFIEAAARTLSAPEGDRGAVHICCAAPKPKYAPKWFQAPRVEGVCNHETRGHISSDLHRYLFVSCFGDQEGRSPELKDFPPSLLPKHGNVKKALKGGNFSDRFRVQIAVRPSTTITSHISKDGHYYIHYDPQQCRSLTVREAARIQTFPDSYFFCGNRTEQYKQVGNAVPPLLARQLASTVHRTLVQAALL